MLSSTPLLQAARINGQSLIQCPLRNGRVQSCQQDRPPRPDDLTEAKHPRPTQIFISATRVSLPNFQLKLSSAASNRFRSFDACLKAFSRLPYIEWDLDSVVTFMVSYISIFHVPLGFGGLTIVAQQLKVKDLALETKVQTAVTLAILLLLELGGAIWLIESSMKRSKSSFEYFNFRLNDATGSRGWVATVLVGLGLIAIAMAVTTSVLDFLHVTLQGDGKEELITQMVSDTMTTTKITTFLIWCILTPCLEEIVYRGYLLQSMASRFGWQWAVILSSCAFTVAHFDILGAPSLFLVGCVLGAAYTWSGNLASSIIIHALYNAFIIYGR